ncbi:ABC transporter ATP-binding protein [Hominenteromicrobium sp.]|uniref:ABC transporter ATP-binding protein n=1 Tax=Hominenteromicrobium sp. TaxID=3073581 RepID=UPI003A916C40
MKIKNKSLQTWAKLLPFLAPYKWQMILIIALMILGACFDMVQPLFSGYAVDNFIEPRTTEGLIPFTAVYLSMVVVQTITTILMAIYALKVEMYLGRDLKRKLFDHLQTLDFSYYNTTPVGTIMARLMSDTGKIGTVLAWSLVDIFWSSMYVLGCVVIMLFVNWKLALILIAIIPIIAVITVVFQKKILAVNRRVRAINAEVTRHYNEGISGAKTSKTLVIEEKNDKAFEKVAEDMRSTTIRAVRLNAVYIPIISFLTAIGVAMVLNQGGNMVLFGDITVGEMTVFINYALIIADPVQQLARTISNFISTQVNIERVSALLEREPLIKDTPEVIEKYGTVFDPKRESWEPIQGHITFDDVTFRYPDGVENVLEHFSLDIPAGTTVAIVGETGAGKSTLVNLACRFFEPTEGRILIDDKDYRERSMLWLHSSIGYVLQTPHLFSGSVRDNIRYGRLDATDEEIEAAAKLVSAHDAIMHMENGYDSDVGEGGDQLSTGEKQLISFARAVLADPRIFVLDEATASIDTKTEELIQHAISTLLENRTSFLIAHRLSTIRHADLILVVRAGKIIEQGTHEELLQNKGYYADLYNKQFEQENVKHVFGE